MAPPLTPMQRIAIVALRNSGCRVSEIARRTAISKPSIHLWLKRYEETGDITARHRQVYKRATTAEQDAAIVAAHANQPYLSTAETAKMFNVTKDTIRRRLKEGGLEHKKERGGGYGKSNRIKQVIKKEKPKFNLADYKIEPGTWAYEPPSASSSKPLLELEVPPLVEVKLEVESDAEPFSPPPPPPAKKPRRRVN